MLPRRTLDELRTQYALEPDLKDVYVEGFFDRDLFRAATRRSNYGVNYRVIDEVDVPKEIVLQYCLTTGAKQRVIAASLEVADLPPRSKVIFVVDKDLDEWTGGLINSPRLRWTKYTSLESYFFTPEMVRHLLEDACGCESSDWSELFSSVEEVLATLFAMRLAAHRLGASFSWQPIERSLSLDAGRVSIDLPSYAMRNLSNNGSQAMYKDLLMEIGEQRRRLDGDSRSFARGHDFTSVIAWLSPKLKGYKVLGEVVAIERMLVVKAEQVDEIRVLVA